ncbi:hypothetical protein ZIOFF_059005 [Zingiber officinale]|uniref:Kelch repeat-containing F-box family protein n=1 Tax=Zingiber officinale TaxID=94328 RepID=A0A8J5KJJ9_ZINOF|nr:hypothetical protein ZIOFF_059005 [Zingiber officinale]
MESASAEMEPRHLRWSWQTSLEVGDFVAETAEISAGLSAAETVEVWTFDAGDLVHHIENTSPISGPAEWLVRLPELQQDEVVPQSDHRLQYWDQPELPRRGSKGENSALPLLEEEKRCGRRKRGLLEKKNGRKKICRLSPLEKKMKKKRGVLRLWWGREKGKGKRGVWGRAVHDCLTILLSYASSASLYMPWSWVGVSVSDGRMKSLRRLSTTAERPPTMLAPLVALVRYNPFPVPRYKNLILFEPTTGVWTKLPAIPDWDMYCQAAAVGHELVVIGGGMRLSTSVHVYNLLTGVRRRGATMPGPGRTAFAFAVSAEARMAYVAGGQHEYGKPLQSALAYDVAADSWVWLPDMSSPRKECRGIFVDGAFCVAGGNRRLGWTSEVFNVTVGRWMANQGMLLGQALNNPTTVVAAEEGRVYSCDQNGVVDVCSDIDGGGGCRRLGVFPQELYGFRAHVATWNGGVMVMGTRLARKTACILEEGKWRQVALPAEFTTGCVQFLCSLQL